MMVYTEDDRVVLITDGSVDDMERSIAYSQRRLQRMQADKGHWWPRFLRWVCGVEAPDA
jgi:hypothetical protein